MYLSKIIQLNFNLGKRNNVKHPKTFESLIKMFIVALVAITMICFSSCLSLISSSWKFKIKKTGMNKDFLNATFHICKITRWISYFILLFLYKKNKNQHKNTQLAWNIRIIKNLKCMLILNLLPWTIYVVFKLNMYHFFNAVSSKYIHSLIL